MDFKFEIMKISQVAQDVQMNLNEMQKKKMLPSHAAG